MEEIITLDGRQFKLSTDRPLTAQEKAQTIAEIRKQTGCGTCGPRTAQRPLSLGDYGGMQSLGACATGPKASGDTITLVAGPTGGVRPYTVKFYRKHTAAAYTLLGTTSLTAGDTEGTTASTSFILTDNDVAESDGVLGANIPVTDTTGAISEGTTAAAISTAYIRVAATVFDQCPTGPQTCISWCDVGLTCVAPTCNFVVS